ncbi:MAG: hypothetical protein AB2693_32110 [Candidatus Thiodiazotropha sp.]
MSLRLPFKVEKTADFIVAVSFSDEAVAGLPGWGISFIFMYSVPPLPEYGRRKKRWEDNIKEWTGITFASSDRAAEGRTRWKGIVGKSFVVT